MRRLNICLLTGQSLAAGAEGNPPLPYAASSNFWMLGDNIGSSAGREGDTPIDPSATIKPYSEPIQETIFGGFARYMKAYHPSEQFTFAYAGIGGQSLLAMDQGTAPYAKSLEQIRRFCDFAASQGLSPLVTVIMINDENDTAFYSADWKRRLRKYSDDINVDYKALSKQAEPVKIITSQTSSHGFYHLLGRKSGGFSCAPYPTASIDKAALCNERPDRWIMAGAKYYLPYASDYSVHLNNVGYQEHGEKIAKVFAKTILLNESWKPLQLKSAMMKDAQTILANFDVPVGSLNWDEAITDPGAKGFSLLSKKGIVRAAITGASQVELTVSQMIGVGDRLQYAWDNWVDSGVYNGANYPFKLAGRSGGSSRGQLRDSDSDSSSAYNQANYCIHCDVPIFSLNTLPPGSVESRTITRLQNSVIIRRQKSVGGV
jgi:hypothetical protein